MFCEINFVMSNIWCQFYNRKNPSLCFTQLTTTLPLRKQCPTPLGFQVSSVLCLCTKHGIIIGKNCQNAFILVVKRKLLKSVASPTASTSYITRWKRQVEICFDFSLIGWFYGRHQCKLFSKRDWFFIPGWHSIIKMFHWFFDKSMI